MVDSGLDKYFSEEEFKEVYYETRNSNPSLHSFYFDTEFIQTLLEYVYYKEYLETANEKISFFHFLKNNLYRTMKQDEQYQTWKEETEKKQDNFTSKTNQELKKLYEKDKHFIDHNYQIHVELIDCMDIIPFSMFLQMYDLADRNYYNENTNIDERLTRIIMERYYEFFIVTNNYQNKISYGDFKQIFNKSKNMFEKLMKEQELKTEEEQKESPNFKNIITQMIEERISALDENINIELLHKQKRK